MNECRYYIYGDEHDETLQRNKKAWKGREYQNLHKRGRGWSFPVEMRTLIDNHLFSSEQEVNVVVDLDNTCPLSVQTPLLTESELDAPPHIHNSFTAEDPKNEPRYFWDVPVEVYDYFKHLMSSLKETRRMSL